jgi:hypothetical protein
MQNITHETKNGKLVITIDLSQPGEPSASGKSLVVASTSGNQPVGDGLFLGVNLYKPLPKAPKAPKA